MQEYDLDDGVQEIFDRLASVAEPKIVGLYGPPNSGKTFVMKRVVKEAHTTHGILLACGGDENDAHSYEILGQCPSFIVVTDDMAPHPRHRDRHSAKYVGKGVDLTVLIKNEAVWLQATRDKVQKEIDGGHYDMVIFNPDSTQKSSPYAGGQQPTL